MKSILNILLALMAMTCLMMHSAQAANILYFNDSPGKEDFMGKALESLSGVYSVTTVDDSGKFADLINSSEYQLGIFMVQGRESSEYASAIQTLGEFIDRGGLAIYTDWSMNNEFVGLFGAAWTGNYNLKQVEVMPPLDTGLENPMDLQGPKDRTWSMGLSALKGSTVAATFDNGDGAIIIGMKGQTMVNGFLTDTMVNGDQGVQLFRNEIYQLLPGPSPVPLPGTAVLLGSGLLGLVSLRKRQH